MPTMLPVSPASESSPTSSKSSFFNKILRRRTALQGSFSTLTSTQALTVSAKRSPSLNKVPQRPQVRTPSKSRSSSEGTYFDDDTSLLYDYDSHDDRQPVESEASSLNSISSFEKPNRTYTESILHEKVAFPTIGDATLDNISIEPSQLNDDPPWVGITYESLLRPKYIRMSKKNKHSPRVINNLFLAQELNTDEEHDQDIYSNASGSDRESIDTSATAGEDDSQDPRHNQAEMFNMEFSRDGKYLAAAGRDATIKIWKVISSPLGRLETRVDGTAAHVKKSKHSDAVYPSAPVFHQKPVKVFRGHTHSILSLNWSKNNFLITGSMDRTAKLWHVDKDECLQTFKHEDFVTTVRFHPNDDRFFISGSLDNHARLWSILENNVAYDRFLGESVLITSLAITPDGCYCIFGGFNGSLLCLETKGLHIKHQVDIKSRSIAHPFQNNNGNKITGIKIFESLQFSDEKAEDPLSKWSFLITTNDSKVRLVNTADKKLVTRFKGLTNSSSSIEASLSDDSRYIISGSEDHWVYIWENNNTIINNKIKQSLKDLVIEGKHHINDMNKHNKYARLVKDNKIVRRLVEENQFDYIANENNSYTAFHAHHSKVNAAIFAPEETKNLLELSDDLIFDLVKRGKACNYLRSYGKKEDIHENDLAGHIIITTDLSGLIRVFRQDSAAGIRKKIARIQKSNLSTCAVKASVKSTCELLPLKGDALPLSRGASIKIDLPTIGRKLTLNARSLLPGSEGYFPLRHKLLTKRKPNSLTTSPTPLVNNAFPPNRIPSSESSSKAISFTNQFSTQMEAPRTAPLGILGDADVSFELTQSHTNDDVNTFISESSPAHSFNAATPERADGQNGTQTPTSDLAHSFHEQLNSLKVERTRPEKEHFRILKKV